VCYAYFLRSKVRYRSLRSQALRTNPNSSHYKQVLPLSLSVSACRNEADRDDLRGAGARRIALLTRMSGSSDTRLIRTRRRRIISRVCPYRLTSLMATNYLIVIGCWSNGVYYEVYNVCGSNDTTGHLFSLRVASNYVIQSLLLLLLLERQLRHTNRRKTCLSHAIMGCRWNVTYHLSLHFLYNSIEISLLQLKGHISCTNSLLLPHKPLLL